jgi:hypothetical protein
VQPETERAPREQEQLADAHVRELAARRAGVDALAIDAEQLGDVIG